MEAQSDLRDSAICIICNAIVPDFASLRFTQWLAGGDKAVTVVPARAKTANML
jgi:hypothetical protein